MDRVGLYVKGLSFPFLGSEAGKSLGLMLRKFRRAEVLLGTRQGQKEDLLWFLSRCRWEYSAL